MQLSAFKLTNRQMLWLSAAHTHSIKHHVTNFRSNDASILQNEYLHVRYKLMKGFLAAYECETTQTDKDKFKEYKKRKWNLISGQSENPLTNG